MTRERLVRVWLIMHENSAEFCVDFKSAVRNTNFPIAKSFTLCKFMKIRWLYSWYSFRDAGTPKDQICQVELLWVHIWLPGYPLTNTRRVPGYPFIKDSMISALNQDQDCQNRPTRSQDMSNFLHKSLWNWPVTSFRATLWLFSHVFTHLSRIFTPIDSTYKDLSSSTEVLNDVN